MRYELGLMDMYPIEASGTKLENSPMLKVVLKTIVDPVKLEDAIHRAIKFHPLFGTQVGFEKGTYYLETNNRPIKLVQAKELERPMDFGKSTNGYPWRICYYEKTLLLEWCHGVTDGRGALYFLRTILSMYYGVKFDDVPRKLALGPGLEPFVDKKEKGVDFDSQPQGFNVKSLPVYNRGYKTDCFYLRAKTEDVVAFARRNKSNPSSILSIMLSKTLRQHLPEKTKNKNVAINIVFDLREPLNYETMHNCVEYKRMTYVDEYDNMKLEEVGALYRSTMNHAKKHENIVRMITERVDTFNAIHLFKTRETRKKLLNVISFFLKDTDCNGVLTYLGKCDFPDIVNENVESMQPRCWHDFGECTLACLDFNGTFEMNICENYIEKGIIEDFIKNCAAEGLNIELVEHTPYEQVCFVEEDLPVKNAKPVAQGKEIADPMMKPVLQSMTIKY